MEDDKHGRQYTSSEVWDRLNQQSDNLSELARAQAATEANLSALAKSVQGGFDSINSNIQRIVERTERPTNWIGIGSLLVVSAGALLTIVALQTDPLRSVSSQNNEALKQLIERELENADERGYRRAKDEDLQRQIELIDQYGSRRWVKD